MANVLIPIADGTEEMEAVILIDVLRRAQLNVCVASVMPERKEITASRGVRIVADATIAECEGKTWDLIALPGGMPGAAHLHDSAPLLQLIKDQLAASRWMAAICAAPAVVLGRRDLISDVTATCYPAFQNELSEQVKTVSQQRVVVHNKLITSQGPGTAMEFALELVALLCGKERKDEVAKAMVVTQSAG